MKYRGIYKITGLMAVVIMVLTTVIGPVFVLAGRSKPQRPQEL